MRVEGVSGWWEVWERLHFITYSIECTIILTTGYCTSSNGGMCVWCVVCVCVEEHKQLLVPTQPTLWY